MAARILIVFATTHGHTATIAERFAKAARGEGVHTDAREIGDLDQLELERFDGVVVGASIHGGRHQGAVVEWVSEHADALRSRPSAFFSVSLAAADDGEEALAATRTYIDEFSAETGWAPDRAEAIAGALQYREYDVFTRVLMLVLMKSGGHPADTTRDYVYTDWDAVEHFGREFAAEVSKAVA